jgi:hypothetical protein
MIPLATVWALKNPLRLYAMRVSESLWDWLKQCSGGSGEIRTHGGLSSSLVFKTSALNRSATLPVFLNACAIRLLKARILT